MSRVVGEVCFWLLVKVSCLRSRMERPNFALQAPPIRVMRDIVFVTTVGFLVAWTAISIWGMIVAFTGFTDTYASIVASSPALFQERVADN